MTVNERLPGRGGAARRDPARGGAGRAGVRRLRARGAAVSAGVLAAVLLAAGCETGGGTDRGSGDGKAHVEASPGGKAVADSFADSGHLPERLAADGTTIVVGSPEAGTAVHVYEDMRCPVCAEFEDSGADELRNMTVSGEVRTEYTLASFLDGNLGGEGSRKAANALRAALEKGLFLEYHDVLFDHQPEEAVDGYTDAFLLRMAARVDGLRDAGFDAAVKGMKYRSFVTASEKAFDDDGVNGTPGFAVDGLLVDATVRNDFFDPGTLPSAVRRGAMRAAAAPPSEDSAAS
jgi:protein-disulfide isomerase